MGYPSLYVIQIWQFEWVGHAASDDRVLALSRDATASALVHDFGQAASTICVGDLQGLVRSLVRVTAEIGVVHFEVERIVPDHAPDAESHVAALSAHAVDRFVNVKTQVLTDDLREGRRK
jgi:hypothetical protein